MPVSCLGRGPGRPLLAAEVRPPGAGGLLAEIGDYNDERQTEQTAQ